MHVLIVDDEPLAQEILEGYVAKTPGLHLAGTCANALEAFAFLGKTKVDLLLLDIDMPEMSGIELLQALKQVPPTILTTAYPEFALTGYELDVVDYLLKPVPFERFLKAVRKAQALTPAAVGEAPAAPERGPEPGILFVRAEGRLIRISLAGLALVEGLKDYVRLWTGDSRILVHTTMKSIEESLRASPGFLRISKSYIVNLAMVTEIDGNCVVVSGQRIAIGATYREQVMQVVNRYRLL